MKKYFFGYLFVRLAKLIAVAVAVAGIGYGLFKLEQASLSAQSAGYQPSQPLRQNVADLTDALALSQGLVTNFCTQNGLPPPTFETIRPSGDARSDGDFATLSKDLARADQQRTQLKETLVNRFETLVDSVQSKLRAHAAAVAATNVPAATPSADGAAPTPASTPRAVQSTTEQAATLYAGQVNNYEIQSKLTVLDRSKELLKVLESAAEDPTNKKVLTDSVGQLDALAHLLPEKIETTPQSDDAPQPVRSAGSSPAPRREFNAEKVADQLARLRASVRQAMLSSWKLDGAYTQAAGLAATEQSRCRFATLAVKAIWVAAFGQLVVAVLAGIFTAFLVLVTADFMQTLLDTATNTGRMADGSVVPSSGP